MRQCWGWCDRMRALSCPSWCATPKRDSRGLFLGEESTRPPQATVGPACPQEASPQAYLGVESTARGWQAVRNESAERRVGLS